MPSSQYPKDKQKIPVETRKLISTNININEDYFKQTIELRKEKWETVKELRKNGTYAGLVFNKIAAKGKYRKQ